MASRRDSNRRAVVRGHHPEPGPDVSQRASAVADRCDGLREQGLMPREQIDAAERSDGVVGVEDASEPRMTVSAEDRARFADALARWLVFASSRCRSTARPNVRLLATRFTPEMEVSRNHGDTSDR